MILGKSTSELLTKIEALENRISQLEKGSAESELLTKIATLEKRTVQLEQSLVEQRAKHNRDVLAFQKCIDVLEKKLNDTIKQDVLTFQKCIDALEKTPDDTINQLRKIRSAEQPVVTPDKNLQQEAASALTEAIKKQGETLKATSGTAPSVATPAAAGEMAPSCFIYEDTSDGIVITGLALFDIPETVSVPAYINGKPVWKIGGSAFSGLPVRHVILPETVKELGYYSFSECKSLISVSAPAAVVIGDYCFRDCSSLVTVELPAAKDFGLDCFRNCSSLVTVELPAAKVFRGFCFASCSSLSSVYFPQAVFFGNGMFRSSGLTEILIPKGVKEILWECFDSCKKLKKVIFSEGLIQINSAFYNTALPSLVLPASVKNANFSNSDVFPHSETPCKKLAVLGMDTEVEYLSAETTVYCLPGSLVQRNLQGSHKIRPLSEFVDETNA